MIFILVTTIASIFFALLFLVIGIIKNKSILSIVCAVIIAYYAIQLVFFVFSLMINPVIGNKINIVLIFCMLLVFAVSTKSFLCIILSLIISLPIAWICYFTDVTCIYKTHDDERYIGVYYKATGITKTIVHYYKMHNNFIVDKKCGFDEDYGVVFIDYKDIDKMSPYEVHFYN